MLGHTFAWLSDIEWRDRYGPGRQITDEALLDEYQRVFELPDAGPRTGWPGSCASGRRPCRGRTARPTSSAEFYELLDELSGPLLGPV